MPNATMRLSIALALALGLGLAWAAPALGDSLQGRVVDENGAAVSGVTISLTGATAGSQPPAVTDAAGNFLASIPADSYTLIFTPPAGSSLVPQRAAGIPVSGTTQLPDRVLRFGVDVTGRVVDPAGTGVADVDLRFVDLATRQTIYTPSDDTDTAGYYAVFVPPATYEIEFRPSVLVDLAPLEWKPVQVQAAGALPTVTLPAGVVVIGNVIDEAGAGIGGVDLDFIDSASGAKAFTHRDDTNEFGVYRTVVVPGVYDIRYLPPPGSGLVARETPGVALQSDVTLPDVTLLAGLRFSGRVVNTQGTGLADTDLNVFDSGTGEHLLTSDDDTDATGHYEIFLEAGTYDVRYTPPAGPPYLPQRIDDIPVAADVVRPDVVLDLGFLVSGSTVDDTAQPVADVDLDFWDPVSGSFLYVARDDSDAAGEFAVAVPGGTYRIDFDPPAATIYLPLSLDEVPVASDLDLGPVELPRRYRLSGYVRNAAGSPLAGVRVEFRDDGDGTVFPLDDDRSDALGYFAGFVPSGSYRIYLEPAPGTAYLPWLGDPLDVDGDVHAGELVLPAGLAVSGAVVDTGGTAIPGVLVKARPQSEGATPEEALTDGSGRFEMLIAGGDYRFEYDPVGLPYLRHVGDSLSIAGDTILPRAVLPPGFFVSGRAVDDAAMGVAGVDVDLLDDASGVSLPLQNDETGGDGSFVVKIGAGVYRLRLQPDAASGFYEIETAAFAVTGHVDRGTLTLPRGVVVDGYVADETSAPLAGVEVEFTPAPGNLHPDKVKVFSDAAGYFAALVPQGAYGVRYDPPAGSSFLAMDIGERTLVADTTLPTAVLIAGVRVSGRVVDGQQAPVIGVDLDLLDAASGVSIPLQGDVTDAGGDFAFLAPTGSYRLRVEPDPFTRLLPLLSDSFSAGADVHLGTLTLASGFRLGGNVVDGDNAPIPGVDIQVVDPATGLDLLLVGDRTDAGGAFLTAVPAGTYEVEYRPPARSLFVARRSGPWQVDGDLQLPTVTLATGIRVSGSVLDPTGAPLAGVATRWLVAGTCDAAFTVRDETDAAGRFEVALEPGSYDLLLYPAPASGLGPERIPSIAVSAPEVVLPAHTLSAAAPPLESCNGLDDDCDGAVDEGCSLVERLQVERSGLSWTPVADAVGYDVVQGDLHALRTQGFTAAVSACLADDTTATAVAGLPDPAPGAGIWLLVRAGTTAGAGSWGSQDRDQGIDASGLACTP